MEILHVISSLNLEGGGPAQGVRNITSHYAGLNVQPFIVCMDEPDSPWLKIDYAKTIGLGKGKGVFSFNNKLIPWLKENAQKFDAVIVHGLWQYHGYAVYKAFKNTSIPYYVFPHGMLDPWFKHEYPLKHIKKITYWHLAQYSVLKHAKAVLFTCEEEKILARESFWPYKVNEKVVNYGSTLTEIAKISRPEDFLEKFPDLVGKQLFLFLSRIHVKKGCDLLITAFSVAAKHNSNLQLVVAGPDPVGLRSELQALAEDLGVAHQITWTGMLVDEVKWGAIKAAEVFILPSHQENFGIVVAESLAVGTPVLISDKVNIWREIQAMQAGLVAKDTLEGTEKLIQTWLNLSTEQKATMKHNAMSCFEQKFNIAQTAKNIIEIIRHQHD